VVETTVTTEAPTTTTEATTTTAAPAVAGVVVTQAPPSARVLGETLARTGAETQALLLVAGMALMLGGIAIYFGESPAAAQRRS
jgi:LPXTG-motif cell wall-anchored protein